MKLQAIVVFLLCAFPPPVEAAAGDDNFLEFCPEGTVQLALESVMKDSSGFTCAQAVGISPLNLVAGARMSSQQVSGFKAAQSCKDFHAKQMQALESIAPLCVDRTTMRTTEQLSRVTFDQRVSVLTS